jgi:hypothetical protein
MNYNLRDTALFVPRRAVARLRSSRLVSLASNSFYRVASLEELGSSSLLPGHAFGMSRSRGRVVGGLSGVEFFVCD